jgi:hypothetical protein
MTLVASVALHGGNGVAGVDGALKGVGADDLGDVGELAHIQLGRHARGHVLAAGRGREQDVAVVGGNGQYLRGHVLGQAMAQSGRVGVDDLGDAGDLRGGGCGLPALWPATSTCTSPPHCNGCGHGVEGGGLMLTRCRVQQ